MLQALNGGAKEEEEEEEEEEEKAEEEEEEGEEVLWGRESLGTAWLTLLVMQEEGEEEEVEGRKVNKDWLHSPESPTQWLAGAANAAAAAEVAVAEAGSGKSSPDASKVEGGSI
ncbi:unnamed protein product [Closterium sp. NIES-54]